MAEQDAPAPGAPMQGASFTMPRMRRAWLREMGIETLWRGPVATALPQAHPGSPARENPEAAIRQPAEVAAAGTLQPTVSGDAVEAALPVQVGALHCCLYRAEHGRVACQWLLVADRHELSMRDSGQALFLHNLLRAAALDSHLPAVSVPVYGIARDVLPCHAALADAISGHRPDAVLIIGRLTRRALSVGARLGHVHPMEMGEYSVPALALPSLADMASSARAKAGAWRALCALVSACPESQGK